jgi:hypothetical protein
MFADHKERAMAGEVVVFNPQAGALAVPSFIKQAFEGKRNDDLYKSSAPPTLVFRGKVWRYAMKGEEVDVVDADGQPRPTIDVVLIKANGFPTKQYYQGAYVEGSSAPPTCWSFDGVTPDATVEEKQSPSCATCKWNAIGSKINEATGAKGKACADRRRVVVASPDFTVGPLLLGLPPTSAYDRKNEVNEAKNWFALAQYGDFLNKNGAPYFGVVTRLGFDSRTAYPKILFKPVRFLTEAEFARVTELQQDPGVLDLLGRPTEASAETETFEQPKPLAKVTPIKQTIAPSEKPVVPPVEVQAPDDDAPPGAEPPKAAKPAKVEKPKPAPVVAGALDQSIEDELAGIFGTPDDQ